MPDDRPTFDMDDDDDLDDPAAGYVAEPPGSSDLTGAIRNAVLVAVAMAVIAGLIMGGAKWLDDHRVLEGVRGAFVRERLD
jgi:hypothetical protein